MAKHASLRASDADRDQIVDRLRKAMEEGRLAAHELEQRVTAALRARTYGELDATVADLPGKRLTTQQRSVRGRAVSTVRAHPALLLIVVPVVLAAAAAVMAFAVVWTAVLVLLFVLGQENHRHRGPAAYARRGRPHPARRGRAQGYSPHRP